MLLYSFLTIKLTSTNTPTAIKLMLRTVKRVLPFVFGRIATPAAPVERPATGSEYMFPASYYLVIFWSERGSPLALKLPRRPYYGNFVNTSLLHAI